MEITCVYIFDGPRKHVDLLEQLLDVSYSSQQANNVKEEEV